MAARPPVGDDDPPEPNAFGIAVVGNHLRTPTSRIRRLPRRSSRPWATRDSPGPNSHDVSLSTAVERTARTQFSSRRDLLDELHDEFERERRAGGGLVSWLRSLVG